MRVLSELPPLAIGTLKFSGRQDRPWCSGIWWGGAGPQDPVVLAETEHLGVDDADVAAGPSRRTRPGPRIVFVCIFVGIGGQEKAAARNSRRPEASGRQKQAARRGRPVARSQEYAASVGRRPEAGSQEEAASSARPRVCGGQGYSAGGQW